MASNVRLAYLAVWATALGFYAPAHLLAAPLLIELNRGPLLHNVDDQASLQNVTVGDMVFAIPRQLKIAHSSSGFILDLRETYRLLGVKETFLFPDRLIISKSQGTEAPDDWCMIGGGRTKNKTPPRSVEPPFKIYGEDGLDAADSGWRIPEPPVYFFGRPAAFNTYVSDRSTYPVLRSFTTNIRLRGRTGLLLQFSSADLQQRPLRFMLSRVEAAIRAWIYQGTGSYKSEIDTPCTTP